MKVELAAVDLGKLKPGDSFLYEGEIYIKCREKVCRLRDGEILTLLGMVIPVKMKVVHDD